MELITRRSRRKKNTATLVSASQDNRLLGVRLLGTIVIERSPVTIVTILSSEPRSE